MSKIKRRKYLVSHKFQLRFAGVILLFMVAIASVSALTIYYYIWMLLGDKLANVYPQARLAGILRSANIKLILNMLLISPFVVLASIILSHRIAGPVYRLKKTLKEVINGNYSQRIHLRKKDELKDLASTINSVINELEKKEEQIKRGS